MAKVLWGYTYETAFSVKQTSNSGYVISGWSVSDDGDVTFNQGNADSWTIYIDSVGNILWQHSYGGTGSDIIYSIETTADNGYILAGITTFDGDVIGNHGGSQEAWILKLDSLEHLYGIITTEEHRVKVPIPFSKHLTMAILLQAQIIQ
ncbi:MAG: hypothetical protein IPH33_19755 [Bacteroidetes bacterium]|nr:hypothetical protein [Bacteroidota bacterium]